MISGYIDKYEFRWQFGSISIWPINNSIFSLRAYDLLSHGSLVKFTVTSYEFLLVWNGSYIQTYSSGSLYNGISTVPQMDMFHQGGFYCTFCGSHLDKAVDDFSLPAACLASSNTVKASQQGSQFMVSTSLISPHPMAKVYSVFSNRVLTPVSNQEQW